MRPSSILVVVEAASERSFDSVTEPAPGLESNNDFWDLVTALVGYLPRSSLKIYPSAQVFLLEVLDLLSDICSPKSGGNHQSPDQIFMWGPRRIFSELVATVTVTGSADTFELGSCGALIHKIWGDVGLDALRLIAAAAFLRVMSHMAREQQTQSSSLDELNDHITEVLQSEGHVVTVQPQRTKESIERLVLDSLFQGKASSRFSSSGEKSVFSSTTSKGVLVVQYTLQDVAFLKALAWACAALRPNSAGIRGSIEGTTRLSSGSFHAIETHGDVLLKLLVWNLKPMKNMPLRALGSRHCWTALFAPGLVVPHKVDRRWGKGLGMSFEMMVHLSASQTYIWIDDGSTTEQTTHESSHDPVQTSETGGYILAGYRSAHIPISSAHDGSQIQWHLERSQDSWQLFLQVHFDLVKAAGLRESPKRVALLGSKIFATELRGLLERPDTGTPLGMIQDPRLLAWVRLAALADAICICSGLGTAIRPVVLGNVPDCECYELPHDRYLLAAHMRCLQDVLKRQCCAMSELTLRGELDFGEGYKMRLNGRRLWARGRHRKHGKFWENRADLIQFIEKESGADAKVRKLLGTNRRVVLCEEDPILTGVIVFGTRR